MLLVAAVPFQAALDLVGAHPSLAPDEYPDDS